MKQLITILSIGALLTLGSCKEELSTININQQSSTGDFTIAEGTKAGEVMRTEPLDYDFNKIASDNGVDADKFKELTLKTASVSSTNGTNFDDFSRLSIAIEADGIEKKTIVSKDIIDNKGATIVNLDVDQSLDLIQYFKGTNLKMTITGVLKNDVVKEIKGRVNLDYNIKVDVLK